MPGREARAGVRQLLGGVGAFLRSGWESVEVGVGWPEQSKTVFDILRTGHAHSGAVYDQREAKTCKNVCSLSRHVSASLQDERCPVKITRETHHPRGRPGKELVPAQLLPTSQALERTFSAQRQRRQGTKWSMQRPGRRRNPNQWNSTLLSAQEPRWEGYDRGKLTVTRGCIQVGLEEPQGRTGKCFQS